jgi:hypothetical protein
MTKEEKKKAKQFAAFITDVAEAMKKHKVEDMLCVFEINGDIRNTYIPLSEKGEMELYCQLSDGIHEFLQSVGFGKSTTAKYSGKLSFKSPQQ